MTAITPRPENLASLILFLRGEKVLLSEHLAKLYGVSVGALNQAVKRNIERFPDDFMFQLTRNEVQAVNASRSQNVILKRGRNVKYLPYAFTEQGIAMLSSVLRSPRAVEVNIAIMRTFVQLRRLMDSNRDLARKIETLEKRYDEQFAAVFDAIKQLIAEEDVRKAQPKRRIGFQRISFRSSRPRCVPIRRTPSVRTSIPISSRATSAMCRRYVGKPRMTVTFHAWISSICRRVGVVALLPDITGTRTGVTPQRFTRCHAAVGQTERICHQHQVARPNAVQRKRRSLRIAIVSRSTGAYSIGRGRLEHVHEPATSALGKACTDYRTCVS